MERLGRSRRIFNVARGAVFVCGLYDLYSSMQQQDEVALNSRDITFVFASDDQEERVLDIRKVRMYDSEKGEYVYPFRD